MIQHHDDPINGSQQGWHGVAAVVVVVEVAVVAVAARVAANDDDYDMLVVTEFKRW